MAEVLGWTKWDGTDGRRLPPPDLPLPGVVALALREGRRRLRLSQRALADRAGVPHTTVSRLETCQGASLQQAATALAAAGWVVRLVWGEEATAGTGAGESWSPRDPQPELRDLAGRRLPPHAEVVGYQRFETTLRWLRAGRGPSFSPWGYVQAGSDLGRWLRATRAAERGSTPAPGDAAAPGGGAAPGDAAAPPSPNGESGAA